LTLSQVAGIAQEPAGHIVQSVGIAVIKVPGAKRWTPVKPGQAVYTQDWLRTAPDGANGIQLKLSNGSQTTLVPGTLVEIAAGGELTDDADPNIKINKWDYGPVEENDLVDASIKAGEIESWLVGRAWPKALPEETLIIPQAKTRDSREWNKSGVAREQLAKAPPTKAQRQQVLMEIHKTIKPWIDDAFQLDDVAKREAVIEKVRAALQSDDQAELHQGLVAFTSLSQIRFDKASFHDLFLPLLKSENPSMRVQAARALVMSGIQDGDIDLLVAMTDDEDIEVRSNVGGQLIWALNKDLTSKPGTAILARPY
jgi:hypothetical protein